MKNVVVLAVALAAGVGVGLVYSWVISPVQIVDTAPDALHAFSDVKNVFINTE